MRNIYKLLFRLRIVILLLLTIIIIGIINHFFSPENLWAILISAILISVVSSFLVGLYFQYVLKDSISKEHLKIMEFKKEFYQIGMLKYYGNFKECISDLRHDIQSATNVDIYIAYGATILNTISQDLNFLLSKPNSQLNIILISIDNPFAIGYCKLWGYSESTFKEKIEATKSLLNDKIEYLKKQNSLNGNFKLFENKAYPINYSFYRCDDIVYFVPTKHNGTKEYVPITIKAQKTIEPEAIYNKCIRDLELMMEENGAIDQLK